MIGFERIKTIATFALLFCVVIACKSLSSIGNPTTLKSTDGKFQLTVPAGWSNEPSLSAKATIGAANKLAELYVIVISEEKSDFSKDMTIDKYTDITRNAMMTKSEATDTERPKNVMVNGSQAREYELNGTVQNTKIAYLVTAVETPDHFHQIITWTLPSKYAENKAALQQVIDSFRPAAETGSDSNTSSKP